MSTKTSNEDSPSWQVLFIIAPHLDPKTLAMASCVSKSWSISMSSDHLWEPFCYTQFPSLAPLHTVASVPYQRIYVLGRTSTKIRQQKPRNPKLSLNDLIFTITVHHNKAQLFTMVKFGEDLEKDPNGVFRFDNIILENGEYLVGNEKEEEGLKATWNVVLKGYRGVFTMMDCKGKCRFVLGSDGWFSEELPAARCCSELAACGLVAELRLVSRENESKDKKKRMVVEKVGVGVLNILSWRYVSMDDTLRYLQHFLMPC